MKAKLDAAKVKSIRKRLAEGASQKALAHEYKVSQPCISQIARGSTWRDAGAPVSLSELKRIAREWGGKDPKDHEALLFVLAALHHDPDPEKVASFTGIGSAYCRIYADRLKENGILVDGKWYVDATFGTDPEATNMEIILMGLVASGHIECVSGKERVRNITKK